ncbi:MAG: hypothetical protein LUP94_01890 [Candidatus Methanomethylicus sp.]|nr:hypothetical protein [Candidatus Methanomethylicus sp.]
MSGETPILNPQELRILYVLLKRGGKSSFDAMMSEAGMCFGMFFNNANALIDKGLMVKGKSFKDYSLTVKGKKIITEKLGLD